MLATLQFSRSSSARDFSSGNARLPADVVDDSLGDVRHDADLIHAGYDAATNIVQAHAGMVTPAAAMRASSARLATPQPESRPLRLRRRGPGAGRREASAAAGLAEYHRPPGSSGFHVGRGSWCGSPAARSRSCRSRSRTTSAGRRSRPPATSHASSLTIDPN